MLTSKQLKLLEYLQQSFKENSVSSLEEMRLALGLKSKSEHRLMALEERGFIKRLIIKLELLI